MTYSPAIPARGAPVVISTTSNESVGFDSMMLGVSAMSSNNYPAVGTVIFTPFQIPEPLKVTKMWWGNGAAVAGNIDVGIYDSVGNLLVSSGSTAQATINVVQTVDVTDTGLDRGSYYFAMVSDTSGATQKLMSNNAVAWAWQSIGLLQQASVTLPLATNASPATFAKCTTAFYPQMGLLANRVLSL